jgi:Sec-independent protein translocase protein TatA
MFDMSWGEMLIIGAVALIVIGPKDLPKTLRTVGNIVGKVRRMAWRVSGPVSRSHTRGRPGRRPQGFRWVEQLRFRL